MNWEQKAVEACRKRGLEVVPNGFEGGYVFVKDKDGVIQPIAEQIVAKWIHVDEELTDTVKERVF